MKYDTVLFLFLLAMIISVPTGFAFASEENDDSEDHDDDRNKDDDDRYDKDDDDDDRYDKDDDDDDRYDKDDDRNDDYDSKTSSTTSERKVQAETLGFQSKIEIEIEFVSDTTDTDRLIDQIIDKFSLTREEAENELRIERSDDRRLEEKFKVEIEKRGNTSNVEVELEIVIDSTSKGDVLDAIVKHSQLTREQITEKLTSNNSSDQSTTSSKIVTGDISDFSDNETLRQENQQLRDEVKQLNQKLDDLQQVIIEQMKVIMETLANLKPQ